MTKVLAALKRASREVWFSVFSAAFLIALWEAAVDLGWVNSAFLVAPATIFLATIDLIASGELPNHISITLARMFAGFFAGTILGLVVGGPFLDINPFIRLVGKLYYPIARKRVQGLHYGFLPELKVAELLGFRGY